jgi:hypothetical protein
MPAAVQLFRAHRNKPGEHLLVPFRPYSHIDVHPVLYLFGSGHELERAPTADLR